MNELPMDDGQRCILIVEDEPKIAALLADYLQAHGGYRTRIVNRGDEALDEFRRAPPDLVLLDLMLPGLAHHHGHGPGGGNRPVAGAGTGR
jgi:two-component system response regulator BaeR